MTSVYVMIRNVWLIMTTHCTFLKKYLKKYFKKCLNCSNSYNICPCVKCVKIGSLLSLSQKKKEQKI